MKILKWLAILLIAAFWCVPARAQQPVVVGNDCPPGAASTTSTSGVTVSCVLEGTGNRWVWKAGGTGGSGTPAGPQNTIQKNNPPGTFAASGISDDGTTIKNGEDTAFIGPNPWVDIRNFGARTFAATTTCTINSGSNAMTIGAASGLINGDGIVCRGAGAGNTMTTPAAPTVSSSAIFSEMNTGRVVAWALGATTYQYQVVAVDLGGGYTIASSATSIANGPATLGYQNVTVSSWTRANTIVTVNTSSAHNLSVNEGITITGVDGNIDGTYNVLAVNSATQFTYQGSQDTRMGAPTTGSAGQNVFSVLCNHVSWAAVTGAYKYLIYGRVSGSMALIGVSWPVSTNTALTSDPKWLTFDDYGSAINVLPPLPDWVPTGAPPVAAKNDDLVTTISAGGGTTSLTVANTASNTVAGATLKFDNVPAFLAALSAAGANSTVYVPSTSSSYNTNSVLNITNGCTILIDGKMFIGDTIYVSTGSPVKIRGLKQTPQAVTDFSFQAYTNIQSNTAWPVIYVPFAQIHLSYLNFGTSGTNPFYVLKDANADIPSSSFDHLNFDNPGTSDDLSTHLAIRNTTAGGSAAGFFFSYLTFAPGASTSSNSPLLHFSGSSTFMTLDHIFLHRRGIYFGGPGNVYVDWLYTQGSDVPELFIDDVNSNATMLDLRLTVQDTTNSPTVAYTNGVTGLLRITGTNGPIGFPTVTGPGGLLLEFPNSAGTGRWNTYQNTFMINRLQGAALEGILSTAVTSTTEQIENTNMLMGANYQFGVLSAASFMPAPVVTVNAGGSIATGAHQFNVAPVFPTSGGGFAEGPVSLTSASVNLTTGNQSISFPITPVAGAVGYDLYDNFFSVQCFAPFQSGGGTTTITWTGSPARCGQLIPQVPVGAPTSMSANGLFAPTVTATTVSAGSIINPTASPWIWTGPSGSCGTPPAVTSTSGMSLCLGDSTTGGIDASFAGDAWTPIARGAPIGGTISGVFNFANYGAIDDDTTDNCSGGTNAVALFVAAVNGYTGNGIPVAIIAAGKSNKAYKLATNSNACSFTFTRTGGVTVHLWANIDCAQTAQSCIQLGPSGQSSEIAGNNYRIEGNNGNILNGANLTLAGIYVEPGVNQFMISHLQFGTGQYSAGAPTALFGFGAANATLGNCTNYSIYIDAPVADGTVDHVFDYVTSPDSTHGGCGIANPNGSLTGSNTIMFEHNIIATGGNVAGGVQCGSQGLIDGGTLGTALNNNIYGFGVPVRLQGIGHKQIGNQIDAANCTAHGVGAAFQIGAASSSTAVGPLTLDSNIAQIAASHSTFLLAIAGDSTATIAGAAIIGNQNNDPTTNMFPGTLGCTPEGNPCVILGNMGFSPLSPALSGSTGAGWAVIPQMDGVFAADNQGANIAATLMVNAPTSHSSYVQCFIVETTHDAVSSTLPSCQVTYTDGFTSTSQTDTLTATNAGNAVGTHASGQTVFAPTVSTAVNISTTGYASNTGGAMKYSVRAFLIQY